MPGHYLGACIVLEIKRWDSVPCHVALCWEAGPKGQTSLLGFESKGCEVLVYEQCLHRRYIIFSEII